MAGIVDILATDLLSASRAVINANYTTLSGSFLEGAVEPNPTVAGQFWVDDTGTARIRNALNTAWVIVGDASLAQFGHLARTGGTMTGAIVLPGDPTAPLQAAPQQYVDNHHRWQTTAPTNTAELWLREHPTSAGNTQERTGSLASYDPTLAAFIPALGVQTLRVAVTGGPFGAGDVLSKNGIDNEYRVPVGTSDVIPVVIALEAIALNGNGIVAHSGGPVVVNTVGTPVASQGISTTAASNNATVITYGNTGTFGYVHNANGTTPDCILSGHTQA